MSELWKEFEHPQGFCGLCGNWGVIDTRGKEYTPAGHHAGVVGFCICLNGRAWKYAGADIDQLLAKKYLRKP
jgi:hypothetical protein